MSIEQETFTFTERDSAHIRLTRPMILTPCAYRPCLQYVSSLMQSVAALTNAGVTSELRYTLGCSDLAHARNQLAAIFLKSECTDAIWIDDDIAWSPPDLLRLLAAPYDIVGAAYCRKVPGEPTRKYATFLDLEDDTGNLDSDGRLTVKGLGLGFLRVSRRAFEIIIDREPHLERPKTPDYEGDGLDQMWRFFRFNGWGRSEDYDFCELARCHGLEIWLDPKIKLAHYGVFPYTVDVEKFVRRSAQ